MWASQIRSGSALVLTHQTGTSDSYQLKYIPTQHCFGPLKLYKIHGHPKGPRKLIWFVSIGQLWWLAITIWWCWTNSSSYTILYIMFMGGDWEITCRLFGSDFWNWNKNWNLILFFSKELEPEWDSPFHFCVKLESELGLLKNKIKMIRPRD
jgi:hypothetical protein